MRPLDLVLFGLITFWVNNVTGSDVALSLVLVGTHLAQLLVFLGLLTRLRPELWGVGGTGRIDTIGALGGYLVAGVGGCGRGSRSRHAGLLALTGEFSGLAALVWVCRNLCGLLAVGCFGFLVAHALHFRVGPDRTQRTDRAGVFEVVVLLAATAAIYGGAFLSELPVSSCWWRSRCGRDSGSPRWPPPRTPLRAASPLSC